MKASLIIVGILCVTLLEKSSAFIHGFPKEQCDEMDPTKIKLAGVGGNKGSQDAENATDFVAEDAPPTSVQLSDSLNLYRIVTSAPKYRRGRTLDSKCKLIIFLYFN